MTEQELDLPILNALDKCNLTASGRRFVYSLVAVHVQGGTLSPRQREALWSIAERYQNRLPTDLLRQIRAVASQREQMRSFLMPRARCPLERCFRASILRDPLDPTARLIYADWLEEERRDREASCQRWIVRTKRQPQNPRHLGGYFWRLAHADVLLVWPCREELPFAVFNALNRGEKVSGLVRGYDTLGSAMRDMERAWLAAHTCNQEAASC